MSRRSWYFLSNRKPPKKAVSLFMGLVKVTTTKKADE